MQTKSIRNYDVPMAAEQPKAKPLSLDKSVRQLEQEINDKKIALDAKVTAARKLRDDHARLQAKVDLALDELAVAKSQHSYFVARLQQLLDTLPGVWANPTIAKSQVVDYSGVNDCRAAIGDWPRVQAILQDRAKAFESELANWEKNNHL